MRPDRYRKAHRAPRADERLRRKIAVEAARRLLPRLAPPGDGGPDHLADLDASEYFAAKRQAAAVLGQKVRPDDLPSDSEVREQALILLRDRAEPPAGGPEPVDPVGSLGEHLDRFAVYRLRLEPLGAIKQDSRTHPEGDALYHSLQVFDLARGARPYDEEFLLAALLHDVGKAIDSVDRATAALDALAGTIGERTAWLIAHLGDLSPKGGKGLSARARRELEESEYREDLDLLAELDKAGRVPGAAVPTVDEALAYLAGLEREDYLVEPDG